MCVCIYSKWISGPPHAQMNGAAMRSLLRPPCAMGTGQRGKETSRARAVLFCRERTWQGGGTTHDDTNSSGTRPRQGAWARGSPNPTTLVGTLDPPGCAVGPV